MRPKTIQRIFACDNYTQQSSVGIHRSYLNRGGGGGGGGEGQK